MPVRQIVQTIAVTPGNPSTVFVGTTPGQNVFVTKWSADGTRMLYSTYLGGSYYDYATGIAVDRQGNAYVTGYTYSNDFPITPGAFQQKTSASYSAFLSKISPDGSTLLYSTYLSGTSGDAANAVAVDASGSAYLTGYAGSADFPTTPGAFQTATKTTCTAGKDAPAVGDAFVTKFNPNGTLLAYSTLLGGSCGDQGNGITVDNVRHAYVVGFTASGDFPVTKGAYQHELPNSVGGFVAKLTPNGDALLQASLIGGTSPTTADSVAVDSHGAIYVTGCSGKLGGGYLVPVGVDILPQAGLVPNCYGSAYLLKLDPTASSKVFLNSMGGPAGEGLSVAVDTAGRAWVAGHQLPYPSYPDVVLFPTVHPFQTGTGLGFVSEWSADGATLLFSSLVDSVSGMALDSSGNAFLTGLTYPAEKHYQTSALITRIDGAVPSTITVEDPQRITPPSSTVSPGVAPGEILLLTGSGLGPEQEVDAQLASDGRVATTLGGTSVTFDGIPASLLSVQSSRITCVVPLASGQNPDGTTIMQVRNNSAVSNSIRMPALKTAIEALAIANQDASANTPAHPAAPGSIVTVYAAGFGQAGPIRAYISEPQKAVDILFAGPAPGQVAGIMQINFRVPQLDPVSYPVFIGIDSNDQSQTPAVITLNVASPSTAPAPTAPQSRRTPRSSPE